MLMRDSMNRNMLVVEAIKILRVLQHSSHLNSYNSNPRRKVKFSCLEVFANVMSFVKVMVLPYFSEKSDINGKGFFYLSSQDKTKIERILLQKSTVELIVFVYDREENLSANDVLLKNVVSPLGFLDLLSILVTARYISLNMAGSHLSDKILFYTKSLSVLAYFIALDKFFKNQKPLYIVNFFSGSYMGSLINVVGDRNGVTSYSYTWGSNVKAEEQNYSVLGSGGLLLKNDADFQSYRDRCDATFLKYVVVGNLGVKEYIYKNKNQDIDLLIIDTCYSENFNEVEKVNLYVNLIRKLCAVFPEIKIVNVKPHPASSDINIVLSKVASQVPSRISVEVSRVMPLEELVKACRCVINVCSTIIYTLKYSDIFVINLFPYYIIEYTENKSLDDFQQFCKTGKLDISSLSELDSVELLSDQVAFIPHADEPYGELAAARLLRKVSARFG